MKPYKLSVYELFERHRRYVVPLFQRPYVWSSEKQWEPLWRDITAKAEEVISAATGDPNRRVRDHFLGAVVQSKIQTFGRQVTALDVIDGQQRLTTLQVLLTAFRDYATIANRADLAKSLARLTYNECLMKHAWEAYKVWPTSTDRETFEAVMQAQTPAALQKTFPLIRRRYTNKYLPRPRLVEAYLT